MKNIYFISSLFFSVILSSTILNELGGTYTLSESPYYIASSIDASNDVTIEAGVIFIINPGGISLNFNNFSLYVYGQEDNPVVISNIGGGNSIGWKGFIFFNSPNININYLNISNADIAFNINGDTNVEINNTNIYSNSAIIMDNVSIANISNSNLSSLDVGLTISSVDTLVISDILIDSHNKGIEFLNGGSQFFILKKSDIINCQIFGIRLSDDINTSYHITENHFNNNSKAIQLNGYLYDFIFSENIISSDIESAFYGIHKLNGVFDSPGEISNNVFFGLMGSIVWSGSVENITVKNNIFYNNKFSIYNFENYEYMNVYNNLFFNNAWLDNDFFFHDPVNGIGSITNINYNNDSCDVNLNLFENPDFTNVDLHDFTLLASSPCIDAGAIDGYDEDGTFPDIGVFYFDQISNQNDYGPNGGCIDQCANNYDLNATYDDGTCDYGTYGCTYLFASNYNQNATIDDNSCEFDFGDLTGDGIMNIIDVVILIDLVLSN